MTNTQQEAAHVGKIAFGLWFAKAQSLVDREAVVTGNWSGSHTVLTTRKQKEVSVDAWLAFSFSPAHRRMTPASGQVVPLWLILFGHTQSHASLMPREFLNPMKLTTEMNHDKSTPQLDTQKSPF